MSFFITPLYAGLIVPLFILLCADVIRARMSGRVSLGDQGDEFLLRKIRAQGNFTEYVPMILLLMAFLELMNGPSWLLHAIGITLLVSRAMHAFGVSQFETPNGFRTGGMVLTFTTVSIAGAANVLFALQRMISG